MLFIPLLLEELVTRLLRAFPVLHCTQHLQLPSTITEGKNRFEISHLLTDTQKKKEKKKVYQLTASSCTQPSVKLQVNETMCCNNEVTIFDGTFLFGGWYKRIFRKIVAKPMASISLI